MPYDFGLPELGMSALPTLGRARRPRSPQEELLRTPLEPEEESSILGSIGQGALSGLSWLGNVLDTPGSVVRGVLAGEPGRALGGIFDWDQRVRGGDLTGNKDADLFSWEGAGNIATEIALDPLTYLSLGGSALTKLGKAASKAGIVPKTGAARAAGFAKDSDELGKLSEYLAKQKGYAGRAATDIADEVAGKSLGGNVGFGLPFGLSEKATFDAAPAMNAIGGAIGSIPVAGPLLQKAGKGLSFAGRHARAALDSKVKNAVTAPGQELGLALTEAERQGRVAGHGKLMGLYDTLPESAISDEAGVALRRAAEGVEQTPPEFAQFVGGHKQTMADNLRRLNEAGYADAPLDDSIDYMMRQVNPEYARAAAKRGMTPEASMSRQEILKGGVATAGPKSINEMIREPIAGRNALQLASDIRTKYLNFDEDKWLALKKAEQAAQKNGQPLADDAAKELARHDAAKIQAERLADFKMDLGDVDYDLFPNHPIADVFKKLVKDETRVLQAGEIYSHLAKNVTTAADGVPLQSVLQKAGLTFTDDAGKTGASYQMVEALRKATGNANLSTDSLRDVRVSKEFADDFTRIVPKLTSPKAIKPFLDTIQSWTNLTKTHQTLTFPGYHFRNFVSGLWQNFVHDGFDPTQLGPMRYLKPLQEANLWRSGAKEIPGLSQSVPMFKGMADDQATRELYKLINAYDVPLSKGLEHTADLSQAEKMRDIIPGIARPGLKDAAKALKPTGAGSFNPLNIEGVFGRTKDDFLLAKAGRITASTVDENNRVAMFIAKLKQGLAPDAAWKETVKAHYQFGQKTDVERVVGLAIPFFGWTKNNIPAVVKELAANPGGKMGTAIRSAGKLRGEDDGLLPKQLGTGLAVPLGESAPGTDRFLGSLGLPFEDLGEWSHNPLKAAMGALNPLLKVPIEMTTGEQLFTGRDLRDLFSPTRTGSPLIDQLAMNSPAGRYIRTLSTLADDRKGIGAKALNIGTGARVTDVDTEKEANRMARDLLQDDLRGAGARVSENLYLPPDVLGNLAPADLAKYRLYLSLRNRAREAARAREASQAR